ncbi:hypothetical protein AAFF_G00178070 [Aldrovandia affinis]|uniref:Uncharacterized protein n=1 Tax=Aldrovandia affinis TaxID=143900 RepID=A0AAD7RNB7_9TELE|nr:hypothetical protein AAFF_G00178070 [Aldrovandia affinis]
MMTFGLWAKLEASGLRSAPLRASAREETSGGDTSRLGHNRDAHLSLSQRASADPGPLPSARCNYLPTPARTSRLDATHRWRRTRPPNPFPLSPRRSPPVLAGPWATAGQSYSTSEERRSRMRERRQISGLDYSEA